MYNHAIGSARNIVDSFIQGI